jgi:hypothetical protein
VFCGPPHLETIEHLRTLVLFVDPNLEAVDTPKVIHAFAWIPTTLCNSIFWYCFLLLSFSHHYCHSYCYSYCSPLLLVFSTAPSSFYYSRCSLLLPATPLHSFLFSTTHPSILVYSPLLSITPNYYYCYYYYYYYFLLHSTLHYL